MNRQMFDRFFHPWHLISAGDAVPEKVHAIIEIPQGSKAKYELDKTTGFLRLDRILGSSLTYPCHYGFVPQTLGEDKDPLDILIICSEPLFPSSIVEATVLGLIHMIDNDEQDDKIIAVASNDPFTKTVKTIENVNPERLSTIEFFFQEYKKPEGKVVSVQGFGDQKEAYTLIEESMRRYKKAFERE